MANLGMQRQRTLAGSVAVNGAVLFDQSIMNLDDNVLYDPFTGDFRFVDSGNYYVSWFVATQSVLGTKGASFEIITNEATPTIFTGSSAVKSGQVSGFAIIQASPDLIITLINNGSGTATYASSGVVTAGISIFNANATVGSIYAGANGVNSIVALNTSNDNILNNGAVSFTSSSIIGGDIKNSTGSSNIELAGGHLYQASFYVDYITVGNTGSFEFRLDGIGILGSRTMDTILPGNTVGQSMTILIAVPSGASQNLTLVNTSLNSVTLSSIGLTAGAQVSVVEIG